MKQLGITSMECWIPNFLAFIEPIFLETQLLIDQMIWNTTVIRNMEVCIFGCFGGKIAFIYEGDAERTHCLCYMQKIWAHTTWLQMDPVTHDLWCQDGFHPESTFSLLVVIWLIRLLQWLTIFFGCFSRERMHRFPLGSIEKSIQQISEIHI